MLDRYRAQGFGNDSDGRYGSWRAEFRARKLLNGVPNRHILEGRRRKVEAGIFPASLALHASSRCLNGASMLAQPRFQLLSSLLRNMPGGESRGHDIR